MTDREVDFRAVTSDDPKASLRKLRNVVRWGIDLEADNARANLLNTLVVAIQ